ncbi:MAG: PilZ domain-containing protein [Candidatus Sulfotelmatobacter sp.]
MPPPPERRSEPRLKLRVPVEIRFEDNPAPFRTTTSDLSLHGCYIETIYPFPVGASLEVKIHLSEMLLILATVATKDPQVGNGLHFEKILPEDVEMLGAFLEAAQKEAEKEKENGAKNAADVSVDPLLDVKPNAEDPIESVTDPDLIIKDERE